ncbi:MAG: alpha/beta hydrolase, partial [Clostridia bacterium]|nr:alpha/beta hydrolase [Clostridia bacterium]
MHITWKMMAPGLRLMGTVYRFFSPGAMPEGMIRFGNRFLRMVAAGHWMSRTSRMEQRSILREDGSQLRLCVCRPKKGLTNQVPGLLWIHGGGYAMGVPEMDAMFVDRFMKAADCVAVLPDYRLSTEAPYPAALDDCWLALKWMKEHAQELGIQTDQLFVGGDSAGGGLCAALSLRARDTGEVSIAFQMPLYPMIDDRMATPSQQDNDAPVWNSKNNEAAWQMYLSGRRGAEDIPAWAAPAREEDLTGMPPTCTYVGTIEPFRDETIAYVEKMQASGVRV